MTVKDTAYKLCKSAIASEARQALQALIHELNVSSDASGRKGRGEFGYAARRQGAHLLGYLLVDQERARISSGPLPLAIPPLADSERQILGSAHAELVALNRACTEPIVSKIPAATAALDPYSAVAPLLRATATLNPSKRMIPESEVTEIALEFGKHSALQVIGATPPAFLNQLNEHSTHSAVTGLLQLIARAGTAHVPSAIHQAMFGLAPSDPNRLITCYCCALLVIRESLRNLNQILYQAILVDKPPILDEDCIVAVDDVHKNILGTSATISFQPEIDTIVLEAGDIALLKQLPNSVIPLEGLIRLETLRFQSSVDFGSTNTIQTRLLDDDLNPYGPLAQPI